MDKNQAKIYKIVAYCDKCNKELLRSNPFSKKKLLESWDEAVMAAANTLYCDCPEATKKPKYNFSIHFKISIEYNGVEELVKPEEVLRKRKS